jgi:hypothetical protein
MSVRTTCVAAQAKFHPKRHLSWISLMLNESEIQQVLLRGMMQQNAQNHNAYAMPNT